MARERLLINGETVEVNVLEVARHRVRFELEGRVYEVEYEDGIPGRSVSTERTKRAPSGGATRRLLERNGLAVLTAPMPGVVIEVLVEVGAEVTETDVVLRIEAMKMQNNISAGRAGKIAEIHVKPGQEVLDGDDLISLAPSL